MNSTAFKGKKIILIIPPIYEIIPPMAHNMQQLGLEVVAVERPFKFKYKSLWHKVLNFLHKTFLRDYSFKQKLFYQYQFDTVREQTKHLIQKADYLLIVRPDTLPLNSIDYILSLAHKVVVYQWDGLERYPAIFDYIKRYEHFYIFDKNDYNKYKTIYPHLKLCTNFYLEDDTIEDLPPNNSAYYVGIYYKERVSDLLFLIKELSKYEFPLDITLAAVNEEEFPYDKSYIKFSYYGFTENLQRTKAAKVLIDIKAVEHDGLSLRFFEALKYKKKIITNNPTVVNYDFYNPNNIFILHYDPIERLGNFLHSDYEQVSQEIVQYYAFSSWLYRVFEEEYHH